MARDQRPKPSGRKATTPSWSSRSAATWTAHSSAPSPTSCAATPADAARATQEQNLVLRFIPEGFLHNVWEELDRIGLAEADARAITNVVSCPGTDSCKLGITSSMGLGQGPA